MTYVLQFFDGLSMYDAVGLLGFTAYLGGFGAVQFGWLDGNGQTYIYSNVLGASLVLISLYEDFNLASALISVSWIIIGYIGIVRHGRNNEHIGRHVPV